MFDRLICIVIEILCMYHLFFSFAEKPKSPGTPGKPFATSSSGKLYIFYAKYVFKLCYLVAVTFIYYHRKVQVMVDV